MNEGLTLNEERTFGQWLKQRRRELDLTQEMFGDLVGCSWETVRKIEEGKRSPSRQVATLMSDVLGIAEEDREAFIHFARTGSTEVVPASLPSVNGRAQPHQTPTNPTNLSTWATTFIGRGAEVATLRTLLLEQGVRFLTLTGPAGIGKSRLSIEAAGGLLPLLPDGVFFVPLSPVTEPALVIAAITQVLGLKEAPGQPRMELLKDYLREKQLLLVLDNFEQVLDAGPLVIELLTACPQLRVIVSSRGPLHVYGEHEFPVPPLAVPGPDEAESLGLNVLSQTEAITLFVARAQAVDPRFTFTVNNAPVIAEICRQLDALPLAIELAAARMKVLSPQGILTRLSSRLKLLRTGPLDAPDRHRTLRNAIEWSYDLLDDDEKSLYRRLSVFVGPRSIDAVEAVCSTGAGEEGRLPPDPEVLPPVQMSAVDGIESLLNQSLLRYEDGEDGERRFYMLWTIREYGLERLAMSGEEEAVRRRHAAYFTSLAEEAEPYLTSGGRDPWMKKLDEELENLRAAMTWCLSNEEDRERVEFGLRMAGALGWYWFFKAYYSEGRRWLEGMLEQAGELRRMAVGAKALMAVGKLARIYGDHGAARTALEESLLRYTEIEDRRGIAYALTDLGIAVVIEGNRAAGHSSVQESVDLFRQVGDKWGLAYALDGLYTTWPVQEDLTREAAIVNESLRLFREVGDNWGIAQELDSLGRLALSRSDYTAAYAYFDEALALQRVVGDKWSIAIAAQGLAVVAFCIGDFSKAEIYYEDVLASFKALGSKVGIAGILCHQGHIALCQGEQERAEALYTESLSVACERGNARNIALGLAGFAGLDVARGNLERAAKLFGVVSSKCDTIIIVMPEVDRVQHDRSLAALRDKVNAAEFEAAWSAGTALNLEQAIALISSSA